MNFKKICLIFGLSFMLVGCGNKESKETVVLSNVPDTKEIETIQINSTVDDILNNDLSGTLISEEETDISDKDLVKTDEIKDKSNIENIKDDIIENDSSNFLTGNTYGGVPMINVYNLYSIVIKDSGRDASLIPMEADKFTSFMDDALNIGKESYSEVFSSLDIERFSAVSLLAEFSGHFENEDELGKFLSTEGYEINPLIDKYSEHRTEDGGISMSFSTETDGFNIAKSPEMTNREIIKESNEFFFGDEYKVVVSVDDLLKNIAFDFYGDRNISFDTDSFDYSYTGNDPDFFVTSVLVINGDDYNRILLGYYGDKNETKNVVLTDNMGHNIYIN